MFVITDFSFWGCLRDRVYKRRPTTLQQLKEIITDETSKFPLEYYESICLNAVAYRLEECRKNSGQLIEPFIS